jgi:hypothetical protein
MSDVWCLSYSLWKWARCLGSFVPSFVVCLITYFPQENGRNSAVTDRVGESTLSALLCSEFCTKLELSKHIWVHLQGDIPAGQFAQNLLTLGEGKLPVNPYSCLIRLQTRHTVLQKQGRNWKTAFNEAALYQIKGVPARRYCVVEDREGRFE